MTDDDLVKRLREIGKFSFGWTADQAANRIEALIAALDAVVDEYDGNMFGPVMHSINAARDVLKGTDGE